MKNYKEEYEKNGFVVIDNFLPKDVYAKMVEIFNAGKDFVEINQIREERYKLWETPGDGRFPATTEDYIAHFWSSYDVATNDYVSDVFNEYTKPLLKEVHGDTLGQFRHQATKMKANNEDFIRVHYDDYTGFVGYVLYLTKETWKYDWGGQLQVSSGGEILSIFPDPNRLVLINHSLRIPHWVNPTSSFAKEDRNNLIGFCVKNDEELPATWTGDRDDYAIY
jgi:hypothetical protein